MDEWKSGSEACVDHVARKDAFDVVDDALGRVGEEGADVAALELVVGDGQDYGVK